MKDILRDGFYQLLCVYVLLVVLISFGLFSRYALEMSLFALVVGAFGFFILKDKGTDTGISKRTHYFILGGALLFFFIVRGILYFGNSIPYGYDTGIYKYVIEYGLERNDVWVVLGPTMEPGFLYFMEPFTWIFSTQFILTWLFIFFNVVLGVAIYFFGKEYFGKNAGLISLVLYSISMVQFWTFTYMYYKNVIALALMLFALAFLKRGGKYDRWIFVILAGFMGAVHRPTFYIFGLSYFVYSFVSPIFERAGKSKRDLSYDFSVLKSNVINGVLILVIAGVFYIGRFSPAITSILSPVVEGFVTPGESPGTFISFFNYQFATLIYLPFAILGIICLFARRDFNVLFFWVMINSAIVYFQFFFFNRFIIHLDIALIILAGLGFSILIKRKKMLGVLVLCLLVLAGGFAVFNEARNTMPLVNEDELTTIRYFENTEGDAFAMSTSSYYSTWLQGYSERRVIAPGLFDYDEHNQAEWNAFWSADDLGEVKEFLDAYEEPPYIFIGERQPNNLAKFTDSGCFETYFEKGGNIIYKYVC